MAGAVSVEDKENYLMPKLLLSSETLNDQLEEMWNATSPSTMSVPGQI